MFLDLFPVSFICFPLFSLDTALSLSLSLSLSLQPQGFYAFVSSLCLLSSFFLSFLLSSYQFIFYQLFIFLLLNQFSSLYVYLSNVLFSTFFSSFLRTYLNLHIFLFFYILITFLSFLFSYATIRAKNRISLIFGYSVFF